MEPIKLLQAEFVSGGTEGAIVKLAGGVAVRVAVDAATIASGANVTLGIMPEHAMIGNVEGPTLEGQVVYAEHLGEHSLVYLDLPGSDELLTVQMAPETQAANGDILQVRVPVDACHLFDDMGLACRRLVSPAGVGPPNLNHA